MVGTVTVLAMLAGSTAAVAAEEPGTAARSAGAETSAAVRYGWGAPSRTEEFSGPLGPNWHVYDGPGHAGNGRRSPSAVTVRDGILTITGNSAGTTAGMAWEPGQKYGRWEGRVRVPVGDRSYNALLLLWPDAENFPVGGEVDFMEMMEPTRQLVHGFLHFGPQNSQVSNSVRVDGTQWHNWAVEWTPDHIVMFVDGREWWRITDRSILPPGPMHLCIQLDWFPKGGPVTESRMEVDWVKQYPLRPTAAPPVTTVPPTTAPPVTTVPPTTAPPVTTVPPTTAPPVTTVPPTTPPPVT
ncbi:glycoside hydrolase family 16 protein, partial [Pseudonocardia hispaniensis]